MSSSSIRFNPDLLKRQSNPAQKPLSCQLYSSPAYNDIINAYDTSTLRWDPSCLKDENMIDIYLQSVDAAQPVHVWKSVTASNGQLNTRFVPDWWNSTSDVSLQLLITGSDLPPWAGHGPGPTFHARFNGTIPASISIKPTNGIQTGGISVEIINGIRRHAHSLSGGKLGAAIFMPLLVVCALIAAYIFVSRKRTGEASKRWSQYVDQRISTFGGPDWELGASSTSLRSVPRARAESIMRHSASLPSRPLSQINQRSSTYSTGNRMSSYSAFPRMSVHSSSLGGPPSMTSQMLQNRVSKVSFADAPTIGVGPRGQKISLDPNVMRPSRPGSTVEFALSPTQEKGPNVLRGHIRSKSHSSSIPDPGSLQLNVFKPGHEANKSSIARSTSNLRFEVGSTNEPRPPSAMIPPPAETKSILSRSCGPSLNAPPSDTSSGKSILRSHTSSNNSDSNASETLGMVNLGSAPQTLSPDEALRQYTISRGKSKKRN